MAAKSKLLKKLESKLKTQRKAIEKMAEKMYGLRDQLDEFESAADDDLPEDAQEKIDEMRSKFEDWATEIETMASEVSDD
jgi:uncharacterized coiled-coil protein SlyX